MRTDTSSGAAALTLSRHQPWTQKETQAFAAAELQRAERAFRLRTRLVHGLFFVAALAGGLLMMVNATQRYTALAWYLGILAAAAGYGAYHWGMANAPPELRLKHWREDNECEVLSAAELSELRGLVRQVPVAHSALTAWSDMGAPIQRRDRAVLEGYLRAKGVSVPTRAEDDWFEQLLAKP